MKSSNIKKKYTEDCLARAKPAHGSKTCRKALQVTKRFSHTKPALTEEDSS